MVGGRFECRISSWRFATLGHAVVVSCAGISYDRCIRTSVGTTHDKLRVAVACLCHGVPLNGVKMSVHCPVSTVSFKPIALVTATSVDSRGLPCADSAR